MTPTKHGRTALDDDDIGRAATSTSSGIGDGINTRSGGGESPSKRARSVTGAAAVAASQSQYAALTGAPSTDVGDSANLCGAAGGLSSMILCCTGGVGTGAAYSGSANTASSRTASLPIPAVMTSHSMGSLGGMADLLLEEESTHGRRGVDQAYSNVTDGKPSPQRRRSPQRQSSLADVSTMSATLGQDVKMLEEARRGSCSGNLRRLGSSTLAQSRAGSFLADMDEEEDYLGTGGRAEADVHLHVGGSGSIGSSIAEEKKEGESIASRGSSTNQSTEKRKLVRKQSAGSKIKGRIRSAFGGKGSGSGTASNTASNGKPSSKNGDVEMEQSLGSCSASVRTDTDGGDGCITGRASDDGSVDHASASANGSAPATAKSSPPAAMMPNIPLIDAASTTFGASGSYSFDLNDLDKQKSIDAAAAEPPAQHVFGPPLGSFLDVRGPIDGAAGAVTSRKELIGTYSTYRMDPFYVHYVVAHMDTMLPLHHHENSLAGSKMWDSISDLSNMRNCCQNADIGKTVKNVCSEPAASSIKVRGGSYLKDSVKVGSAESMFSVLGVDIVSNSGADNGSSGGGGGVQHCSKREGSYLNRLRAVCQASGLDVPFLLVVNFVLPFGNLLAYHYRPDGTNGGPVNVEREGSVPAERLWRKFLEGDKSYRDKRLKFVPRMVEAPWMVKKMVGSAPALIAQKLPTTYYGSIEENYLEISLDVTAGPAIANTIATTVAGKSDAVTVDLAFLIEGLVDDEELPEQVLALYRLHHVNMKKTLNTEKKWAEEIKERQVLRMPDNDGVEML